MKKQLLFITTFVTTTAVFAQQTLPHMRDFENETLGSNIIGSTETTDFYSQEFSGGQTQPTTVIANGINGTKVIYKNITEFVYAPGDGSTKNHYLRTPAYHATPGNLYSIDLDINASNGVINFRIQGKTALDAWETIATANSVVNSTSPSVTEITQSNGKIKWGGGTQISVNIAYTAPAGYSAFRVQLYQWGTNSYELDNLSVIDQTAASVTEYQNKSCKLKSTLVKDELTVISEKTVKSVTIIDMKGINYLVKNKGNQTYTVSSLQPGSYVASVVLVNGSKENIQFVKH